MPLVRICSGCARRFPPAELTRGRCINCSRAYERDRSRVRSEHDPYRGVIGTSRWQRARAAAKRRDGNACVFSDHGGCSGRVELHHVQKIRNGGAAFDLDNLVTVCRGHHSLVETRGVPL